MVFSSYPRAKENPLAANTFLLLNYTAYESNGLTSVHP
jgi:hypothetical protein